MKAAMAVKGLSDFFFFINVIYPPKNIQYTVFRDAYIQIDILY